MKTLILSLIIISASSAVRAQNLTPAQKEADFRYLASLYSTYYAPVDWKKQLFNFDALAIQPWLDRAGRRNRGRQCALYRVRGRTCRFGC